MSRKFLVPLVLPADPTAALEAATKQYVDTKVAAGGAFPTGGVLGDILVKNSATNGDALWGTAMPKLTLTSTTTVDLTSTLHALSVGLPTGSNMALGNARIQARSNGALNQLDLNPVGGQVRVGAADAASAPAGLLVSESIHATSRRATLQLGSGWQAMQDISGNGTKDFTIYQIANSKSALVINAAATQLTTSATNFAIGGSQNLKWYTDGSTYSVFASAYAAYYDGTSHTFRRITDGAQLVGINNSGQLDVAGNIVGAGEVYAGTDKWFRVRGNTGIYWESWGGGWNMTDATWLRVYGGKWLHMGGGVLAMVAGAIRLAADPNDANHSLIYSSEAASAIDPASGLASNGPKLKGYYTVWLNTVVNNRSLLFEYTLGNVNIPSAGSYAKFSTIEVKDEIAPLDRAESLAQVRRWEPVTYRLKLEPTEQYREGFIAEHLHKVTPKAVVCTSPDAERPDWPNSIDYGQLTVRLTAAVQHLADRIEQLERKAA